jgi:hypothetical protein
VWKKLRLDKLRKSLASSVKKITFAQTIAVPLLGICKLGKYNKK